MRVIRATVSFVAGDDWWTAIGIGAAVAATGLLTRLSIDAWWLLPLAVPAIVALSLTRATRQRAPSSTRRREPAPRG